MTDLDTATALVEAFKYWPTMPDSPVATLATDELRRNHRGHYFDRDTCRAFGMRNFSLVAPGVSVELNTTAPASVPRYAVVVWTSERIDRMSYYYFTTTPTLVSRFATRRDAVKFAGTVHHSWETARSIHQATKQKENNH